MTYAASRVFIAALVFNEVASTRIENSMIEIEREKEKEKMGETEKQPKGIRISSLGCRRLALD